MPNSQQSFETLEDATEIEAEVSRLEVLRPIYSERVQLPPAEESSDYFASEVRKGPVSRYLGVADGDAQRAIQYAKADLAVFRTRMAARKGREIPSWLKQMMYLLLLPLLAAIFAPPIVNLLTARQQLDLFERQSAYDAKRQQADLLLGSLTSTMIVATNLKSEVEYHEAAGLSEGQADRLYNAAVQLEQDLRMAVQLHHFEALPSVRDPEITAYYEIRALQECLLTASGRANDLSWKDRIAEELKDADKIAEVLDAAVIEPPCGSNFHAGAFQSLLSAIDVEVSRRLGGALFPAKQPTGEDSAHPDG